MINLAAAQRIIEIGIHKTEEVDRSSFAAAQAAAVEFLLVRGVPGPEIASGLGVRFEDIGAVERKVKSTKAKQRYQDACLTYALADGRSAEAAEYLFVRGFTRKRLQMLGFKADTKLSFIKRTRYWRTLIAVEQKADEGRRSAITTEQAAVEFLLVRGVPVPEIASGLGVPFEVIHAVERTVEADKAIQRYQDACLECARADNHTREAAEYLYVCGFTPKRLRTLGFAKANTELNPVKRARYWRKLIAQARARLQQSNHN